MNAYNATISWELGAVPFDLSKYSRAHTWSFDGGLAVPASASPLSVRVPLSDPTGVDPEEALVAAVSSCHMLWFLSIAAKAGHSIVSYRDHAVGVMGVGPHGKSSITRVTLRPHVVFAHGSVISDAMLDALHEEAHGECNIAHSITADVLVECTWEVRNLV